MLEFSSETSNVILLLLNLIACDSLEIILNSLRCSKIVADLFEFPNVYELHRVAERRYDVSEDTL